jgi:hypothetical protein
MGVASYDTNKIQGIYPNIVDQHPLQFIRKVGRAARVERRMPNVELKRATAD